MPPEDTGSPETLEEEEEERYSFLMGPPPHPTLSVLSLLGGMHDFFAYDKNSDEDYRPKQPKHLRGKYVLRQRTAGSAAKRVERAGQPPRDTITREESIAVKKEDPAAPAWAEREHQRLRDEITREDVAAKAEVLAALEALKAAEAAGTHPRKFLHINSQLWKIHCAEHIPHVPGNQLHAMSHRSRWIETGSSRPIGNGERGIPLKICFNKNREEFNPLTCRRSTKPQELEEGPYKIEITLLGGEYLIAKIPRELALKHQSEDAIAKAPEYFTFYGVNAHYIEYAKAKATAKANADADPEFYVKARARAMARAEEVEENWDDGLERWR